LQHIGLTLGGHQCVDRVFDLIERFVLEPRSAVGIAHAASKVAIVGDFKHGHTRVLLMIRAQTAIQRTTLRGLDLSMPWEPRWQSRIVTIKPTPIATDEVFA
jgi:hypothetical protein